MEETMIRNGDIFDLGTNEYMEFLEHFDDLHDLVIHYTREPAPSLAELKLYKLIERDSLAGEFRKIGPNEKSRLAVVYSRARQQRSEELQNLEGRKSDQ